MAQINYGDKTISCKIVYYGPGLSGKTTNLQEIFGKTPGQNKGKMVSLATEGDRTLYFDFLPLDLGEIKGFKTKFQLYTVPGQVYYNATRKLVLKGVDAVVFVADSSAAKMDENKESLQNLMDNLNEINLTVVKDIPFVIQYNKRDLPDALPVEELRKELNTFNVPDFEAVAFKAVGIFKTLKAVAKLFIENFHRKYGFEVSILDADTDAFNSKTQQKESDEEPVKKESKKSDESVKAEVGLSVGSDKKSGKMASANARSAVGVDIGIGIDIDIDLETNYSTDSGSSAKKLDIGDMHIINNNAGYNASSGESQTSHISFDNIELENHRNDKSDGKGDLEIEDINFEDARFSSDLDSGDKDLKTLEMDSKNFSVKTKGTDSKLVSMEDDLDLASLQAENGGEDDFESDINKLKSELTVGKSTEIKPPQNSSKQGVGDDTKQVPSFKQMQKPLGQVSVSKSGTVIFAKKKKKSLFGKLFSMLSNKGD